jgi:polyisoprenoid-binding protein YceI
VFEPDAATPKKSPKRWITWLVLGGVGAVVLFFAGIFVYTNFINDAPDELDERDLSAALTATTTDPGAASTTNATTPTADSVPTSEAPDDPGDSDFDGDWVPTTASEFGYRVQEVLAGVDTTAVGRSNAIDGLLTIDGTTATVVDISVQISDMASDNAVRDGQFRGRIMNAPEFPTAEFRLTKPIDFGQFPIGDEQVVATATGELTLRGVTNAVSFDVTAQSTDGRIGVLGSIPVVFEDYGIPEPSLGPVSVEDNGLVEFVLVFERP